MLTLPRLRQSCHHSGAHARTFARSRPATAPPLALRRIGPKAGKPSMRSASAYRGVTLHCRTGRYEVHIWDGGKQIYLGGAHRAVTCGATAPCSSSSPFTSQQFATGLTKCMSACNTFVRRTHHHVALPWCGTSEAVCIASCALLSTAPNGAVSLARKCCVLLVLQAV